MEQADIRVQQKVEILPLPFAACWANGPSSPDLLLVNNTGAFVLRLFSEAAVEA